MDAPNIVFITIDSLRADHTTCLDYERNVDPRLSELRERGNTFQQAVANGPNTTASFPSILTGAHSLTYGPYGVCGKDSPFLSCELKNAGYQTVGYHSNPHLGEEQGYPTGFDLFNDAAESKESIAEIKDSIERLLSTDTILYRLLRRAWHYFSTTTNSTAYARADTISENAINWINEKRIINDPFFMWLHYMDVHYPFNPPKTAIEELSFTPLSKRRVVNLNGKMQESPEELTEEDIQDLLKLYDAEIRYTDSQIGRVLDTLEESGILENTIVIITADHGEAFGEHDRFGHHPYPYDELIKVPLIIAGPGIESRDVEQQISLIDISPTVLDLIGIEPPSAMEGQSFASVLAGNGIDDRTAIMVSDGGRTYACRTDRWKYISRINDNQTYLYSLTSDPAELKNISAEYPEITERFESVIDAYRNRISVERHQVDISYDPEIQQRLADLGYK